MNAIIYTIYRKLVHLLLIELNKNIDNNDEIYNTMNWINHKIIILEELDNNNDNDNDNDNKGEWILVYYDNNDDDNNNDNDNDNDTNW